MNGFPNRSYYGKHTGKPVRTGHAAPPSKEKFRGTTPKKPARKNPENKPARIKQPISRPTPANRRIDAFEAEYQAFIAQLKAKKAAEEAKKEEQKVEPVIEPTVEGLD